MSYKTKNVQLCRWYLLRVTDKYSEEVSLYLFGGLSQKEKSFLSIIKEGERAFRAGYNRLLLPWNFVFHSEKEKLLDWLMVSPQLFALSVHKKSFKDFEKMFERHKSKNLLIDLLLENNDKQLLEALESGPWPFQITVPAHRKVDLNQLSDSLSNRYKGPSLNQTSSSNIDKQIFLKKIVQDKSDPQVNTAGQNPVSISKKNPFQPPVHFHFPCYHKKHPQLYSSEEIYEFLKKSPYPPPYTDIYNLSIPSDLELEPEKEPEFSYRVSGSQPMASVIIPTYNCSQELIWTLKHLFWQDLPKQKYEVIVVDDGSEDMTAQTLKHLDFLSCMNFKFIFLHGQHKRESFTNHRFRAGIARNLGVKQAQGSFLLFLDSDILVPSCYLSSVCEQLKTENVIQHPRYHLIKLAPKEYNKIDKSRHLYIKDSGYWENFYNTAQNWKEKKLPWKYISTNTLCLKTSVFKSVGRFRKNYTCYGFEDTDLGYRLYQAGFRFKLNPVDTYHLFRSSEHVNSSVFKRKLLGQSARIFFHNNHNLEGYEEFRHLIDKAVIS